MFEITPIRGSNQYAAAHYFSSADDYYRKEEHGLWQGQGAQELGLSGVIDPTQFASLLAGKLPNGERIQTTFDSTKNKKRMGWDLTFSAPKSVSMQALIGGDKRVIEAHDKAVSQALIQIEKLAQARKKIKGKSTRERTGKLVIGKFRHELSRAKDPQLHTHAVALNMTQRADGAWRALANEDLFVVKHEIDAIYKVGLAKELQQIGYALRLTDDKGNFELAHISRQQIEAFSARSRVIEDALARQGKTRETATAIEKQIIAIATRGGKEEGDREALKQYWLEKSRALHIDYGMQTPVDKQSLPQWCHPTEFITPHKPSSTTKNKPDSDSNTIQLSPSSDPAQAVVRYALTHLTEREAVVGESALVTAALRRAVGLVDESQVRAELQRLIKQGSLIAAIPKYRIAENKEGRSYSLLAWQQILQKRKGWTIKQAKFYVQQAVQKGSLLQTEQRYTTQKALQRERAILAMERCGRETLTPILQAEIIHSALSNTSLSLEQKAAVQTMLSTLHRFVGIQGDAGTGKTYSVNQALALINHTNGVSQHRGYRTLVLAPYGNQVKALKNEGLDAHTLASFLYTKNKPIDDKTLVILDEAAVVGSRQMEQLMRIVEKNNARMVFLGDTKQTEAIEAGQPFAQLQKAGMQTTRIKEIQRQKNTELKIAVKQAADGRSAQSLNHLHHITEIKESSQRHASIVTDYLQLSSSQQQQTIIIAGTNEARREINQLVREALNLSHTGRYFDALSRIDLTQAQRRFAPSYQKGMVIQAERDYPQAGLVRGEIYYVQEARSGNIVVLERADKTTLEINPSRVTKISVYQLERTELTVGDTIRLNRNDAKLDLTNGDRMRVTGILSDVVKLEALEQKEGSSPRAVELAADKPLHLEHAYASTIHSAQGLSSDRSFISIDTQSRTTSMNLYYVAISRAKHEARIYTNSIEKLPQAITRIFSKTTALEIQREKRIYSREQSFPSRTLEKGEPSLHKPKLKGMQDYEYGRY